MAPEIQAHSPDEQEREERLAAEWVNVGVCGGMYRPPNGHAEEPIYHGPAHNGQVEIDEADWQPHNRCCL